MAVADTIKSLSEVHEYCIRRGAHMIAILQPNIYTLRTKSVYEKTLEKRFSRDMKTLILGAYKNYEDWVKVNPFAVSATHIFNDSPGSVFLDWAHANALGSELIAEFIYNELSSRKLISD